MDINFKVQKILFQQFRCARNPAYIGDDVSTLRSQLAMEIGILDPAKYKPYRILIKLKAGSEKKTKDFFKMSCTVVVFFETNALINEKNGAELCDRALDAAWPTIQREIGAGLLMMNLPATKPERPARGK